MNERMNNRLVVAHQTGTSSCRCLTRVWSCFIGLGPYTRLAPTQEVSHQADLPPNSFLIATLARGPQSRLHPEVRGDCECLLDCITSALHNPFSVEKLRFFARSSFSPSLSSQSLCVCVCVCVCTRAMGQQLVCVCATV